MFCAGSWDTKDYFYQVVQAADCRWCYSCKLSLLYSMQLSLFYFLLSPTFICPSVETMTNLHLLQTIKWDETWLFACIFDERTVILFNCLKFVYVVCPSCVFIDPATFLFYLCFPSNWSIIWPLFSSKDV